VTDTLPAPVVPPVPPDTAAHEPFWAKPSIGIYTLTLFVGCLVAAWATGNQSAFLLIIGAVISNATQVVAYYFGSSAGSQRKTDIIAASVPPTPPPTQGPSP
jgi:hypothetical protein